MACLSPTAAENRLQDHAASTVWRALCTSLGQWLRSRSEWREQREIARLDERGLRDLGIRRDSIERRDFRDLGQLWLDRPPL